MHLVEPLGFELSDRYLKRAGLDYWPHIDLHVHPSLTDVLGQFPESRVWFFSARATTAHWDVEYGEDDILVFGREADGLPAEVKERFADRLLKVPHNDNIRSLNLSNTASVALYEALRQIRTPQIRASEGRS